MGSNSPKRGTLGPQGELVFARLESISTPKSSAAFLLALLLVTGRPGVSGATKDASCEERRGGFLRPLVA